MIHDHSSDDFQASYTINGITYPFPSSVGIQTQPSCWSDIGIAGFQTVLDSQAHLIRFGFQIYSIPFGHFDHELIDFHFLN
jgi:hypothetical protein